MAFVKLHGAILDSSVWAEPHATRIVWITMLAMANEEGVVEASVGGLARRAMVTREECDAALATFLGPDPDSRDGTTGERIEKVPGGWLVLNHQEYRAGQTRQQALTAARVRRHRAKKKANDRNSGNVTCNDVTTEAEAEAELTTTTRAGDDPPIQDLHEALNRARGDAGRSMWVPRADAAREVFTRVWRWAQTQPDPLDAVYRSHLAYCRDDEQWRRQRKWPPSNWANDPGAYLDQQHVGREPEPLSRQELP